MRLPRPAAPVLVPVLFALCAALCGPPATALAAPAKDAKKAAKPDKTAPADAVKKDDEKPVPFSAGTFAGLGLRLIGSAMVSGRIVDLAVDPTDPARYFVAVASGGVWRTDNAGVTFTPVFDQQGSYSIGCVTVDPRNPSVVWVGTGENNSQRSVGYGDGLYKSVDGGASWKKVGLERSEHIGKILIDPRDSRVVYVAAQGPLWGPGGDRGLYKTTDGGATWKPVLTIDENTGVSDIVFDPRDPDVIYAVSYQRRRHVWTLINGGPGSGIHKTTDGGASWTRLTSGLPAVDLGRIGLAISPAAPDTVYATVEAAEGNSGFYRSRDRGATWQKLSSVVAGGGQYYQEIFADPIDPDRVYMVDVFMKITEDGGRTWRNLGEKSKHVDNHAVWIDPKDTRHLRVGCDGGLYESWDRGENWEFKPNLPVTQCYRVTADNKEPFYTVYCGTQDNTTIGAPSRTTSSSGIINADWFMTVGGDGFQTVVDPLDPDIVYSQWQYGFLVRYDRKTGETIGIKPQEGPDEPPLRWNWDSPLILSAHRHTRLYFAANRIYRTDDRGDSWRPVSPDLTRKIERNTLPVMGKVWGPDAVAKNNSTSFYGNIVTLAESPKNENLLYAGTDDGLIQVTEDGGKNWRAIETVAGVPDRTYVSKLLASQHDDGVVYAAFDNHKNADFKSYVFRSADRGTTWTSIRGDLPAEDPVLTLAEDHVDPKLLFAGTEHGLFFTSDGGTKWIRLTGNFPTIAVRDLFIQKRENDLVVATFGRGVYILDDYTPLRAAKADVVETQDAVFFPVKTALQFNERTPFGGGKGSLGESFFTAPNPPLGAVLTFYLKDEVKTPRQKRKDAEKEAEKKKETLPYPSLDALRAETRDEIPKILVTIADAGGRVVRRFTAPASKGIQRVAWDLRYPSSLPTELSSGERAPWDPAPVGPMVVPGRYTASLALSVNGTLTPIAAPQSFDVKPLGPTTLPVDRTASLAFEQKVSRLQRAVTGAIRVGNEVVERLRRLRQAHLDTPAADAALATKLRGIADRLDPIMIDLRGDDALRDRQEITPLAISDRVDLIVYDRFYATAAVTKTHEDAYAWAAAAFQKRLAELRTLVEQDLAAIENELETAGAPWTPGRLPAWQPEGR